MVDDGVCDGDHARVRLPLTLFITSRMALIDTCHPQALRERQVHA